MDGRSYEQNDKQCKNFIPPPLAGDIKDKGT